MHNERMTVKEAATHLGVTPRTVRLWIESGRLSGERVQGRFGPEWRLDSEQVVRAADRRTDQPIALDLAGRPGGNDLRAIVAVLGTEIRKIQEQHQEYTQYVLSLSDAIEALRRALPPPAEVSILQGLLRQSAHVQQTVEEESRARHREAQELQAAVQALASAVEEQTQQTAVLAHEVAALRQRLAPWYRRLFMGHKSCLPPGPAATP
jgi:excisionase family DNA binding protein